MGQLEREAAEARQPRPGGGVQAGLWRGVLALHAFGALQDLRRGQSGTRLRGRAAHDDEVFGGERSLFAQTHRHRRQRLAAAERLARHRAMQRAQARQSARIEPAVRRVGFHRRGSAPGLAVQVEIEVEIEVESGLLHGVLQGWFRTAEWTHVRARVAQSMSQRRPIVREQVVKRSRKSRSLQAGRKERSIAAMPSS